MTRIWQITSFYRSSRITYVVMSPSHLIVPFLRVFTSKPIVLDAGWPLLDGKKVDTKKPRDTLNQIKIWLLDFVSFHSSSLVLFESQAQNRYSKRRYFLFNRKIEVSYTGFDETQVASVSNDKVKSKNCPKPPYVLFRGKVNEEAGLQNIVSAFSKYDISAPLVILTNLDLNLEVNVKQVKIIKEFVSMEEMSELYKGAVVCLGQLSSHPRIARTIPHKAFEAGFFGTPYISIKNGAVSEIFSNGKGCHFIDNDSPREIAQAINWILDDPKLVHNYAQEMLNEYRSNLSQEKIYINFIEILTDKGFN